MNNRVYNFYAGPGALPLPVLERAHAELFNFQNLGMSVMELSHRTPQMQMIIDDSAERIKQQMGLGDAFEVIFLQGGGSLQFIMIPLNLSRPGEAIDYIDTGHWTQRAIEEAERLPRDVAVIATTADSDHNHLPADLPYRPEAKYVHICTNNTTTGTQWRSLPKIGVPYVADMSSDFLARVLDVAPFDLIYAHAQKNIGLSGVTAVIIRKSLLADIPDDLPKLLDYRTHIDKRSNYHTPACFSMYITWLMLQWLEDEIGGVAAMAAINEQKAKLLYDYIDNSSFYRCPVPEEYRSVMNVVFHLETAALEGEFVVAAEKAGFVGVGAHRTRTGCRVSLYNAVTVEAVEALIAFMYQFEKGK
ncbi:MAG TPA: 3-phosphoserine/phosphohydroxythreonine transaminase [Anaerolineae bacterium]|nr:3-phosphoserine/phosphohydroxythreonine transaminase [Anaerolineae bacterium]